jgi:GT2 family glycosyltransferase
MDFASLAVLSFKRPEMLQRSIQSLKQTTFYPHELIIHDDGDDETWFFLQNMKWARELSTLIINTGMNMGVGEALHRCWSCAKGKYLVKLDADLLYHRGWLENGVRLLEKYDDIGALGFFAYTHPHRDFPITRNRKDPSKDTTLIEVREDEVEIVHDFVSSAMLIRREHYERYGLERGSKAFAEDVMLKRAMQADGLLMAITPIDWIQNIGFGEQSVVAQIDKATGKVTATKIAQEPLLFSGAMAIARKLGEVIGD